MRLPLVVAALLCVGGSIARADSVVLKNGAEYEGILKEVTPDRVVIQSDDTDWTFARDKVASWKRDRGGVVRERAKARAAVNALNAQTKARRDKVITRKHQVVAEVEESATPSVIVYGTSWCGFCRKARAYLTARHVPYLDKDIERDTEAHDEMLSKCAAHGARYSGVPVIDVGGQLLLGFNQEELDRLLAHSR